ncbi:MAG: hypothetical protein IT450_19585 [Phycisphaerales bacterium]|nr:hypothetical protein [Phycisphaerales bacterium]
MRRLFTLGVFLCALPGATRADPYWVAWEGNDFPENEGWERQFINGGSYRTIIDGSMRVDSTQNHLAYDQSWMERPTAPKPGESFVAEWRLRIDTSNGRHWDQAVVIATESALLVLGFYQDSVVSEREAWSISIQPGVFHSFRVESSDGESYSLYLDGAFLRAGSFEETTLGPSGVSFGDATSGGLITSRVDWDYFRFGLVPEPSPSLSLLILALTSRQWRRQ